MNDHIDVMEVIEDEGPLTPEQQASSGSIADLSRWMDECVETRVSSPDSNDAAEALRVWQACRNEMDRRNGAISR